MPQDEARFRAWYSSMAKSHDLSPDPDDPQQFYDYRAAFRAGAKPDKTGHWPSDFKKPGHPNMIVGGFNVQTGERVPGTPRVGEKELVRLGWDAATAARLAQSPEPTGSPKGKAYLDDQGNEITGSGTYLDDQGNPEAYRVTTDAAGNERFERLNGQPLAHAPRMEPPGRRTWGDTAKDAVGGVRAGLASTVYGGGDLIRRGLGMERVIDTPEVQAAMTPPDSTAGRVGKAAEQIGEFFLPTGLVGKAGKVAEVIKSGALTTAQTGSPTAGGVSAGITAAMPPVAKLATKAGGALKESALETMANSLKATKEWAKDAATDLAPEMLKRGVGGSIKSLRAFATESAKRIGKNLNDAYDAATQAGSTVPGGVIRGNIQLASDALHTRAANGQLIPVPSYTTAIQKLKDLDEFVAKLPPDIPVNQAAALKRAFDDVAEVAGLFGPGKMASASEKKEAWAFREAANAIREKLNTNATIADLNKELSFWIPLRDVVNATKLRKVGQTGGAYAAGAAGIGAGAGYLSGDSAQEKALNAMLLGVGGRQFVRLMQSPAFMNKVSGPLKDKLADALASGSQGQLASVMSRITASLPSQLTQSVVR